MRRLANTRSNERTSCAPDSVHKKLVATCPHVTISILLWWRIQVRMLCMVASFSMASRTGKCVYWLVVVSFSRRSANAASAAADAWVGVLYGASSHFWRGVCTLKLQKCFRGAVMTENLGGHWTSRALNRLEIYDFPLGVPVYQSGLG